MSSDDVAQDEFRRIRQACHDLGADEEMTALVLESHRYDRTRLDIMVAAGSDLLGYVRHRLAVWETILGDSPDDPGPRARQNDRNSSGGWPISGEAGH
jgi:hypothetical protein